ncbi:MAG: bifunctional hydroxymethylpyrimidine kinase/phosphomethylpyrimidine kinase, partial [Lentisphaeria bacterium]|nr:bifunctional hydroxymethylpyrimidine kinase/phosphomethylpyrimidine kinase [Lentisphaeria bacterium]
MNIPVCLTIAGSDSSGGAGIQADLKAFAYFTTFGTSAVTAITAQTPSGVSSIFPVPVDEVLLQYRAVTETMTVKAIKTGMLTNADIVGTVCDQFDELRGIPIIVDPVIIAGSGDRLVEEDATEL